MMGWTRPRLQTVVMVALAAAAVAVAVFGVPLGTVLLVGLWLLCPLLMMGMHGGHGHGRGSAAGDGGRGGVAEHGQHVP